MMERELDEVKYSIRRSLCMEVGEQLGKHWAKVRYEDLSDPRLKISVNKMNSLKAIFGTLYVADLAEHEAFIESHENIYDSPFENISDKYDSIEDLLIHDMILLESKLDDKQLKKMSDMYNIDFDILKKALPHAEDVLYQRLQEQLSYKL